MGTTALLAVGLWAMAGKAGAAEQGEVARQVVAASQQRAFDIPAQPLASALTLFGDQSGMQITVDSAILGGLNGQAVSGTLPPEEALRRLLAGTGISWSLADSSTFVLSRIDTGGSSLLEPLHVTGHGDSLSQWETTSGFVATRATTGSKTNSSLLEVPQTINVVTSDQIAAQGASSLAQALRYTPGVVAQYGDTDQRYDWFTVRGFTPPGRYLDGLRLPFGARGYSQPRIEPYGLEQIEILKGPASVLYGQGYPGGMINMVSKRPTEDAIHEVELQYGTHDRYQTAFDFGGKADQEGDFLYRIVGLGRLSQTQYDHVKERKGYIAPSLTYKPDEKTSITLLAEYQKIDSPGGGGGPSLPANGTLYTGLYPELPRDAFVGEPDYDSFKSEQAFIGYEASHQLDDTWTFRQNLRYAYVDTDTQRVQAFCGSLASCNPAALNRYAWAFPESARMFTVDNQAIAHFFTGAIEHTLLSGIDYSYENSRYAESALSVLPATFNAYDPDYSTVITRPDVATRINQNRSQVGLYSQDQMKWERFVLTLGGRYDWADTDTRNRAGATDATVRQKDRKFTWRSGLVYNFDNGVAPYVSYSTSFNPASGTARDGKPFNPTTGEQYEAGVKYQPAGMDSFITVSAYQLTQKDVLTPDPVNYSYKVQTGEVRVRGLEVEGKGEISDAVSVIASYAYTDSKITRDNPTAAGVSTQGNRLSYVPRHQAALWLDYAVQSSGAWGGVSMGGGPRYVGQTFGDNNNLFSVPGYTLFDAALRYDLGRLDTTLNGLQAAINVSNLLNKKYVSSCLGAIGCYWGDGRTIYATLNYKW